MADDNGINGTLALPLLLLDLGGVLADLGSPAEAMGLPGQDPEFWRTWLESPAVEAYERGRLSHAEFCRRLAPELGMADGDECSRRLGRWQLRIYPGIADCVERAARHFRLALLSNTNELHWRQVADTPGVFVHFSKCFLSFETGYYKPETEAFTAVIDYFGCQPADVVFLDDSQKNVSAAEQIGMRAARIAGGDALAAWVAGI